MLKFSENEFANTKFDTKLLRNECIRPVQVIKRERVGNELGNEGGDIFVSRSDLLH